MEISGTIAVILPMVTGTSARGEWKKLDVVIEQPGEYPKKAVVTFFGDKAEVVENKYTEGMEVTVHINIEAREHNGKWYNSVNAWKIESKQESAGQTPYVAPTPGAGDAPAAQPAPKADGAGGDPDDLPF